MARLFDKADETFPLQIEAQESLKKDGNALSRREFVKILLALSHGKAIYDVLDHTGLLPDALKFKKQEIPMSGDYLIDWDAAWGSYIASSFKDLVSKLGSGQEWKLPSGEAIERQDIMDSWLIAHALELELREKFTVGFANDVFKKYMTPRNSEAAKIDMNIMQSGFEGYFGYVMDRVYMRDYFGAAFIQAQKESGRPLFRRETHDGSSNIQRSFVTNVLYGEVSEDRLADICSDFEKKIAGGERVEFPYWFGWFREAWETDFATIFGKKTTWYIQGSQDVGEPDQELFCKREINRHALNLAVPAKYIERVGCEGEFSAAATPFEQLNFQYDQLSARIIRVIDPILNALEGKLNKGNMLELNRDEISHRAREFYASMITRGFMDLSPFDYGTDHGETWEPALMCVNVTPKFMQILEAVGLATPVRLHADYEPLLSQYARAGMTYEGGGEPTFNLDYGYSIGGEDIIPSEEIQLVNV